MFVDKIPKRKASTIVVEQIEKMIELGEFKAGDKLPSVRELCELFDVGRSTIRDAISTLSGKGTVYVKQGEGTFIYDFDSLNLFKKPVLSPNEKNISELFQVRKILEAGIAKEAAQNRTKKHVIEMEHVLYGKEVEWEQDYNFHMLIAKASGNPILVKFMEFISEILRRTMINFHKQIQENKKTVKYINNQHVKVYEAIRDGLPEIAYETMLEHLTYVEELVTRSLVKEKV